MEVHSETELPSVEQEVQIKNDLETLILKKCVSSNESQEKMSYNRRKEKYHCIVKFIETKQEIIFFEKIQLIKKERTTADIFFITQALEKHQLFSKLTSEERENLATKFFYCKSTHNHVYQIGDVPSLFFVVVSGECYKKIKHKTSKVMKPQDSFGNLDIIRGSLRSSSVIVQKPCEFWALEEKYYKKATQNIIQQQITDNYQIIHNHEFFQIMNKHQKNELLCGTYQQVYRIGEIIAKEDEIAEAFFIIKSGSVAVKKGDSQVIMLGEGSEFGNKQFLQGSLYGYTYVAYDSNVQCLAVQRNAIERIMGQDVLKFEIDNLQRYACETNTKLKILTQLQIEKIIQNTKLLDKEAGDIIFKKNQPVDNIYFVLEGSMSDEKGNTVVKRGKVIFEQNKVYQMTLTMAEKGQIAYIPLSIFNKIIGGSYDDAVIQNKFSFEHFLNRTASMEKSFNTSNLSVSDLISIKKIGQGHFGEVHLSKTKNSDLLFAVKIQSKSSILQYNTGNQIVEEKKIMEQVNFPFLMRFYGALKDQYNIYFLLEYICGRELFDAMRDRPLFSAEEIGFYAGSIILCLEYLNSIRIVYRDLKPENIMLDHQGYVKLIDFGASKRMPELAARTFTITGTPTYLAPEIMEGRGYSYAVDLWSLGIILYELLCGPAPYGNDSSDPYQIYNEILQKDVEYPEFVKDQQVKDFINQLLSKKSYKRLIGKSWPKLKAHPYFEMIKFNWESLMKRETKPPYIPKIDQNEKESAIDEAIQKNISISEIINKEQNVVDLSAYEKLLFE